MVGKEGMSALRKLRDQQVAAMEEEEAVSTNWFVSQRARRAPGHICPHGGGHSALGTWLVRSRG